MIKSFPNFRLVAVCIAAASVGLSMVIVSIAKLLLLLAGVAVLLMSGRRQTAGWVTPKRPAAFTPILVLVCLAAFVLSLLWTSAPAADALGSIAKYGKLLGIVLMLALIRDRREARLAFTVFLGAQLFLLISSWLLYLHLPLPWATSNMAMDQYAVFSSYLDQGIMAAVVAALCWHLRKLAPGRYGPHIAVALAVLAMANVLFVLKGRSGHVVAIALLSLAIMWELPRRYRAAIVLLPFVLAAGLFFGSSRVHDRSMEMAREIRTYEDKTQVISSSGIRLGLWHRAGQIIAAHPLTGAGIGSWSTEYNRLQRADNPAHVDVEGNGNPHQEYLLWGVQLGVPGLLLFAALLLAVVKDSWTMDKPWAYSVQSVAAALAVASLFNASLYDALIGDFFCITLGVLLAAGFTARQPAAPEARPTAMPAAA